MKSLQNPSLLFSTCILWVLWGYNYVSIKKALIDCTPFAFASLRTLVGFLCLGLFLNKDIKLPTVWKPYILIGFFNTFLFVIFSVLALQQGQAGKTALLSFTMPLWTLLLSFVFLKESIFLSHLLAMGLSVVGAFFILYFTESIGGNYFFAILSGLSLAISTILSRYYLKNKIIEDVRNMVFWQMVFGFFPILILASFENIKFSLTHNLVINLLYSAIPANAFAWVLWFYLVKKIPASLSALNIMVIPVISILMSSLEMHERFSIWEIMGVGLMLIGFAIIIFLDIRYDKNKTVNSSTNFKPTNC